MVTLPHDRPAIMGILNVTPDSFSDGGQHFGFRVALDAALRMVDEGADLIDVGGESTRPGAAEVSLAEEISRVMPVIEKLLRRKVVVSIDTMKPEVARIATKEGVQVVNDVSGLRNPEMIEVCVGAGCQVCVMHMQGDPRTMQQNPTYANVVEDVRAHLLQQCAMAEKCGIAREKIWIDPGIGFGKTVEHNLILLRNLSVFSQTGYDVLVGVSRKSFIGKILGSENKPLATQDRSEGTLALEVLAQLNGAKVLRTHNVLGARRATELIAAVQRI